MEKMDLRVIKTRQAIEDAFLESLRETPFQAITVKQITKLAQVNRSTFYKHYLDKYDLKDQLVDRVLEEFTNNLEISFIDEDFRKGGDYYLPLRESLEKIRENKQIYMTLWEHYLPDRDVFHEMIEKGCKRLEEEIKGNQSIKKSRKEIASLYTHLFLGTMLISVRWWFSEAEDMDVDTFTRIMILHMDEGIIQTLQGRMDY